VGGGKDCAHRTRRRSLPRGIDAAKTKAWDVCGGGIWSIASEDPLSFGLKGAGNHDS